MERINSEVTSSPKFPFQSIRDIRAANEHQEQWVWEGYLAVGGITLLTSMWKSGKTTLLSVLLAKMHKGGTLAGLAVRPGRAVVLSEENPSLWATRDEKLNLGSHVEFSCRPFQGLPSPELWREYLDELAERHRQHPIHLLVIDPLTSFLPNRAENDAGSIMQTLLPLQKLTSQGISVLILHHPKKGTSIEGQAARGSGALTGGVDVLIEMKCHGEPSDVDRRRRLTAWSRFERTPRRLQIELNAAGTDYLSHGDFIDDDFHSNWRIVYGILIDAADKISRREILDYWPDDYEKPHRQTLWRLLDRAVKEGLLK
ncbi:MAG: helicase RepA family protein [Planctomycetes bacterium]|nr:helicase RepA family protein [Planctomycetota bacterium]